MIDNVKSDIIYGYQWATHGATTLRDPYLHLYSRFLRTIDQAAFKI